MKKLFIVLVVTGALVACNNSATTTGERKDSIDSVAKERKEAVDSTAEQKKENIDSSAQVKKDAIERTDSLHKKDSAKKY